MNSKRTQDRFQVSGAGFQGELVAIVDNHPETGKLKPEVGGEQVANELRSKLRSIKEIDETLSR